MSDIVVLVNGESKLRYDRLKPLPPAQLAYLDRMDRKMDAGIVLDGEPVAAPDRDQRARFVAAQLLQAVLSGNEPLAAATLSYLASRLPGLTQLRAEVRGEEVLVDMVFDEPYVPQSVIRFTKPRLN